MELSPAIIIFPSITSIQYKVERDKRYLPYKPRISSRIGGNILATRVVNDWNDLSDEVVKAVTVDR